MFFSPSAFTVRTCTRQPTRLPSFQCKRCLDPHFNPIFHDFDLRPGVYLAVATLQIKTLRAWVSWDLYNPATATALGDFSTRQTVKGLWYSRDTNMEALLLNPSFICLGH